MAFSGNNTNCFLRYLVIFCVVSLEFSAWAQTQKISFEEVRTSSGNSLGKINAIVQDRQGFMWFSDQSNGAIVRYDGSSMKFYYHDPDNPNSLGGPYPESMWVTESGIIWIGFYGQGLDRFDPITNTFTHFRHDPEDPKSLSHDYVWAVLEDHLGNIWVGTEDGLDLLDSGTGTFKHFRYSEEDPGSLSHNVVRSLYEDRQGTLWIGTGFPFDVSTTRGGLNRFDRETEKFTRYLHDPEDPNSLISNKVRAILEDSHGNFWVGTDGDGLHTMDRKTGIFQRHTYDPGNPLALSRPPVDSQDLTSHITFLVEDVTGRIWIGTNDNGLNRYDPSSGTITYFGNDSQKTNSVVENPEWDLFRESSSGWCAYATDDGLVWLSTQRNPNKVFKIDLYSSTIPLYRSGFSTSFLEEDSGDLWIGSWNGLVLEDSTGVVLKTYMHSPEDAKSLSYNLITAVKKDHLGKIWVGTQDGLNEFDASSDTFRRYLPDPGEPGKIGSEWISSIFEDSRNNLWVGTGNGGLNVLDRKTQMFRVYRTVQSDINSISGDEITVICEDKKGYLWVGAINEGAGLNRFDPKEETFKRYLPGLSVVSLLLDAEDQLWVGTVIGLYKYDPEADHFDNTGITSNITLVINDFDNNLWLYTSNGIIKYDPRNGNTILYGEKNGVRGILQSNSWMVPYRKRNGTILFGTEDGYYAFNPQNLRIARDTSLLYITDFRISGNSELTEQQAGIVKSDSDEADLILEYDQRDFSIYFTAIAYRNSATNQISYTLENYDLDWLKATPEVPATYFKVPPGEYTFRMKTLNKSSGIPSEKNLTIVVLPPWWATWWAYSLYALTLALIGFQVHRYQKARTIRQEREKMREQELAQAREIEKAYTQLKQTQAQLIQSEKMASLGELTAGIAHEIQNPLNFVNNFSEVNRELIAELKEESAKKVKERNAKLEQELLTDIDQNLEKISHHGQRADSIVKGMLQHSRSNDGEKEPTDLNRLADEYLRLAYHGLRAKDKSFNATLETDFDDSLGDVEVVPQDIGRVLLNLLTNAFHAVSEKQKEVTKDYVPTVTVRTRKTVDGVEIAVTDNGNGIPEHIRDKIFQPFFTTKPTGEGTGLGLSMSYDIVTKGHGGELKVASKVQEGTEFIVTLPV